VPQVDVLRSKILADFTSGDIHSLLLQSREQSAPVTLAILPTSTGAPRWMYQTLTEWLPATETGVADLLSALTVDAVEGFTLETLPAGQEPDKSITITLRDAPEIHYDLFSTAQHTLIQRRGEDFSAILSSAHARKVQTQPSTWKDNQLWQLSSITLRGLQRQVRGRPLENYSYNFNLELWKGQVGGVPVDEDIDAVSANALLSLLESLRVDRWLPTHEAQRLIGEGSPVASVLTLSQKFTLEGELDGLDTKTLALYPMPGRPQQVICGLQEHATPTQYGLLSKKGALRLIAPLVQE